MEMPIDGARLSERSASMATIQKTSKAGTVAPTSPVVFSRVAEVLMDLGLDGIIVVCNCAAQPVLGKLLQDAQERPPSFLMAGSNEAKSPTSSTAKEVYVLSWRCRDGTIQALQVVRHTISRANGKPAGSLERLPALPGGERATDALYQEIRQQVHMLSESITAIANYIVGCQQLLERDEKSRGISARDALARAIVQLPRARASIKELRSLAAAQTQRPVVHHDGPFA